MKSCENDGSILECIFFKAGADAEAIHDFHKDVAEKKAAEREKSYRNMQQTID